MLLYNKTIVDKAFLYSIQDKQYEPVQIGLPYLTNFLSSYYSLNISIPLKTTDGDSLIVLSLVLRKEEDIDCYSVSIKESRIFFTNSNTMLMWNLKHISIIY